MTDAKTQTQAMPADTRHKGQTKGMIPEDERGAGGGGPIGPKDKADKDFHGGQTNAAYHGHGRLGEDAVEGQDNPNAPSEGL